MAKNSGSRKLLRGYMDGYAASRQGLGMAKRQVAPRPKGQFRPTFIRQWRKYRGLTLERLADALQTDVASLLMRDPTDSEALWSIWDHAKPGERKMIIDIAKTVTKTGTNDN